MFDYEIYLAAAEKIRAEFGLIPETAVVLGSGLTALKDKLSVENKLKYSEISCFADSTNPSHEGTVYLGVLGNSRVLLFSGRAHCYEGYSMAQVTAYVTVLGILGVKTLILTNSAGGINKAFNVGDIMLITDHIKLCAESPATGKSDERLGKQFFDLTDTYSADLRELALKTAKKSSLFLREGVYIYCAGPQYETPAEINAFRVMGADAVGMSTVPEAIAAAKAGIRVLAFSLITNMAAGVTARRLDDSEVVETASKTGNQLSELIYNVIQKLDNNK